MLTIFIMMLLISVNIYNVWACFDPTDTHSAEVLINKPSVSYNFTLFETVNGITRVNDYVYIYRSHIGDAVVIVYVEECVNGVPAIGDHASTIEYYPGIRVELLNISMEYALENKENITMELKNILAYELNWLSDIGVIKGITREDIDSIVSTIRAGFAGWNSRLIYYSDDGKWHPYYELVNNGLIHGVLVKSIGCRWEIPASLLPDQPPDYMVQHTNTSKSNSQGREVTYNDGYYVLIAAVAGLLVAIASAIALKRTYTI